MTACVLLLLLYLVSTTAETQSILDDTIHPETHQTMSSSNRSTNQSQKDLKLLNNRRILTNNIDLSQTTVTGLSNFEVWKNKTITVIPRDTSGNLIGDECDIYIQISNLCTVSDFDNICTVDASATDIVSTSTSLMIYNNDGQSYNHSFTVDKAGQVSVFIYVYKSGYIKGHYYTNIHWAGSKTMEIWNEFNLANGQSSILAGGTEHFSYRFDTYLKGPITGMVDFYLVYDDGLQIMIDEMIQPFYVRQPYVNSARYYTNDTLNDATANYADFSYSMTKDRLYRLQLMWNNAGGGGDWMHWYWNYTGHSRTIIPSSSYIYPYYINPSVISSY